MTSTRDGIREMALLGEVLCRDLDDEIRAASAAGWDIESADNIRISLKKYLSLATGRALVFVAAELAVILLYGLAFAHSNLRVTGAILAFALAVAIAAVGVRYLWPAYVILPKLRNLPPELRGELMRPVWGFVELACVGLNAVLLLVAYPSWVKTLGVLATLAIWGLWLAAPWALFMSKRGGALLAVRGIQTAILIVIAISTAGPVDLSSTIHNQSSNKFHATEPNDAGRGHGSLYSRQVLVSSPTFDARSAQDESARIAREAEARRIRQEAETAQREAKLRADRVKRYVPAPSVGGIPTLPTALVALDAKRNSAPSLAGSLSKLLSEGGIEHRKDLFTAAYVSSRHFQDLLEGREDTRAEFSPEVVASRIIFLETNAKTERHSPVAGVEMLRAEVILRVGIIDTASRSRSNLASYLGVGAGYHETDAINMAEERARADLWKKMPSLIEALRQAR